MNAKVEAKTFRFGVLKWIVVVALAISAAFAFNYYDQYPLLYRVLALLAVYAVALALALTTAQGNAFWNLLREAQNEVRRVVWPTRQEATQTTLIVVVFVLLMAVILWALDSGLGWAASKIIG